MQLLPEAARAEAVRKAAPDIADRLPLRFDRELANPCVRHANGTLHGCLPAFFIAEENGTSLDADGSNVATH